MQGIGLIGVGGISHFAHLKGYKLFNLPVVAGFDISKASLEKFAAAEPQAKVYDKLDDLLTDPNVTLIDLATPHHRNARVPVIEKIAAARKPVLIQKPMAMCYADALEIVELLEKNSTPAMVNQNMCFTPGAITAAPLIVDQKILGEPFLGHMELRYCFDCDPNHWFGKDERWWTIGLTVHHLAVLQMFFGPPERVYAVCGKAPEQPGVTHDGYGQIILSYPTGLQITMLSTGTYYGKNQKNHGSEELWVQGPLGLMDWLPCGNITLTMRNNREKPENIALEGNWFFDAFGLAMQHFQKALAAGKEPLCSVQDNLYVMAVMEAAYLSSSRKQAVSLQEIMGKRYQDNYGPGWNHGYHEAK